MPDSEIPSPKYHSLRMPYSVVSSKLPLKNLKGRMPLDWHKRKIVINRDNRAFRLQGRDHPIVEKHSSQDTSVIKFFIIFPFSIIRRLNIQPLNDMKACL